jgi:hypothetical protein
MPDDRRAHEDARRTELLTAMTTEHFVLQTAANTTFADAAARSSLYVFSLSSSLVAIGFISQSPDLLPPVLAIVLPAVFVLGTLTFVRLVDTALENQQYLAGIARIRRYYRSLSPEAEAHFAARLGRWPEGPEPSLGLGAFIAYLGTTATMIAFVNSVVAGAGVALVVDAIADTYVLAVEVVAAVVTVAVLFALYLAFQRWRFRAFAAEAAETFEGMPVPGITDD